jgi:hypothetical protein
MSPVGGLKNDMAVAVVLSSPQRSASPGQFTPCAAQCALSRCAWLMPAAGSKAVHYQLSTAFHPLLTHL